MIDQINFYIFPLLILSIVFISIYRNPIQNTETNIFKKVLVTELAALVLELLSNIFDGRSGSIELSIIWITNLLYFIIGPLAAFFWTNFASYIAYERTVNEINKKVKYLCLLPYLLFSCITITSPVTGWLFTINSDNYYERGSAHIILYILIYFYMLTAIFLLLFSIRKEQLQEKKKQCIFLSILTLIPLLGGIVQEYFNTLWISFPLITLLILLIYIYIQNRQITTDVLTGINNRGFFEKYIKNLFEQNQDNNWYLFIMDIDSFKSINDTYGHTSGDTALIETGEILEKAFIQTDSIVARYGGDEFAAIVTNCNEYLARDIISKIHREADEFNIGRTTYKLSISVGYSRRDHSDSIRQLIASADKMMYANKKEKKER